MPPRVSRQREIEAHPNERGTVKAEGEISRRSLTGRREAARGCPCSPSARCSWCQARPGQEGRAWEACGDHAPNLGARRVPASSPRLQISIKSHS